MDPSKLALTPAATPPPGVRPNFVNPQELHVWIVTIAAIGFFLMVSVLALRIFTKAVVIKSVDWSDYNAFLGFAFTAAFFGCALGIDFKRRGRHQWDMSILTFLQTTALENVASIVYCIGIMFSKLSILLLFMKVFVPFKRGAVYWTNQALIYVNGLFYFGAVISLICQCIPRAKISNPTLPGKCTDVYLSFMISGVFNVLSDFFILIFPIWAIWHLQMPMKRKFGISIVFATGVFALLSSIMRLHATSKLSYTEDKTWIIAQVALWTLAEMTTVLLCGSFPVLPKLAHWIKDKRSSRTGSRPSQEHLEKPYPKESSAAKSDPEHAAVVHIVHEPIKNPHGIYSPV